MCWLRWISSGRFSQERGVKKKKKRRKGYKTGLLFGEKAESVSGKAHVCLSKPEASVDPRGEVVSSSSVVVVGGGIKELLPLDR